MNKQNRASVGAYLSVLALAGASAACSVLLKANADQCSTDGDCAGFGASFVCGSQGVCVERGQIVEQPDSAAPACSSTAQCTADRGGPSLCREPGVGSCIDLTTTDCPVVVGPYDDPSAVFIAYNGTGYPAHAIDPLTRQAVFDTWGRNVELGVNEFNQTVGGLPGVQRRPIVSLQCPYTSDPAKLASHLFDVVKVSAVITGLDTATDQLRSKALQTDTLLFCGLCANPSLEFGADNGLVWHAYGTTRNSEHIGKRRVADLEAQVRANLGLAPADPIRVAFVANTLEGNGATADTWAATVEFNGKVAAANGSNFLRIDIPGDFFIKDGPAYQAALQIAQFQPHIVIPFTHNESARVMIPTIEANWPGSDAARPVYLYGPRSGPTDPLNTTLISTNEPLRLRMSSVNPSLNPTNLLGLQVWQKKFEANFGYNPGAFGATYDGFYSVALAMTAVAGNSSNLRGSTISAGFAKLVSGAKTSVGAASLTGAVAALAAGGSVDLEGIISPLDWDLGTGGVLRDWTAVCPKRNAIDPNLVEWTFNSLMPGGLVWRSSTKTFEGAYICP